MILRPLHVQPWSLLRAAVDASAAWPLYLLIAPPCWRHCGRSGPGPNARGLGPPRHSAAATPYCTADEHAMRMLHRAALSPAHAAQHSTAQHKARYADAASGCFVARTRSRHRLKCRGRGPGSAPKTPNPAASPLMHYCCIARMKNSQVLARLGSFFFLSCARHSNPSGEMS